LWDDAEPDLNPLLAALFMDAFERRPNNSGAVTILQGMLAQFPDPPRVSGVGRGGDESVVKLRANGEEWSRHAQLLEFRPVVPFQWSDSPYRLAVSAAPGSPVLEHAGVDYLLAYWLAKDSGLLTVTEGADASPVRRSADGKGPGGTGIRNRTNAPVEAGGVRR